MRRSQKIFSITAALAVAGLASGSASGASFTPLGALDGDTHSSAAAVSADGSTVVGMSVSASGSGRAFIWDRVNGIRGIPDLPGDSGSNATGVSADGSTVLVNQGDRAFLWNEAYGARSIDPLPDANTSYGRDLSADGSTIVGRSGRSVFIWDVMNKARDLGNLPGGFNPAALSVSADGSTVVGRDITGFGEQAFVWDALNGMQGLGDLPGGFPSFDSLATDVSADGSIVVGLGSTDFGTKTFIWDAANGMHELEVLLRAQGVDLSGWRLNVFPSFAELPRISADGLTIVGIGEYEGQLTAYVAVIPEPSTALLLALGLASLALHPARSDARALDGHDATPASREVVMDASEATDARRAC